MTDTAPPPTAQEAASVQHEAPTYDFAAELANAVEQQQTPAREPVREEPRLEPKQEVKPKAEPKKEAAKPETKVEAKAEPAKEAEPEVDLLGELMAGKIVESKPGDAPTDPGSREFQKWSELRSAYDTLYKEKKAWEKEKADLAAKVPKDYEDILKERDELRKSIAAADLTKTPEFRKDVVEPLTAIYKDFEGVAEQFGLNKALLQDAIETENGVERDRKLEQLFADSDNPPSPAYIARLGIKADRVHEIYRYQQQLLANAPDILKGMTEEKSKAEEAQKAKEKETYSMAASQTIQMLQRAIPVFKTEDGATDSDLIETVKAETQREWSDLKPAQKAFAMAAPLLLQKMVERSRGEAAKLEEKNKEVASLKLQLAKLTGSAPSTAPAASQPTNGATRQDSAQSFEDLLKQGVADAYGRRW